MFKLTRIIVICAMLTVAVLARSISPAVQGIDFNRDIRPIFEANCNMCHGPAKASAMLRLDSRAAALKGGMSGAVIKPGDSSHSRLLIRILGEGGEKAMPLGRPPLTSSQIELIRKWIDSGASWPDDGATTPVSQHWAYVSPSLPKVPEVKNSSWIRNPIDNFILARLEREDLRPSPEAAPEVLLRRVYLDLTGLPPSVKEIDEFLSDRRPDAWERVVDRLLASKHFGERWARPWLDLARYADSNGYEKDNLRVMWKYRDWVINAFNSNLPFDQFTIEQLAGDLLPNPTSDQLIATGFHRNTLINQEGGIDPEEARFEILVDRVNTTSTVWLGSTMNCAQCHNHKYDPFTQSDYYKLYAFFNSGKYQFADQGTGEDSRWVKEPILDLPSTEQEALRKRYDDQLKEVLLKLITHTPTLAAAQEEWIQQLLASEKKWTNLVPLELKSLNGAVLSKLDDDSVLVSGPNPETEVYTVTSTTKLTGITAIKLEVLPDASLPQGGPGRDPYGNFLVTGIEVVSTPLQKAGQEATVSFKSANVDNQTGRIEPSKFFTSEGDKAPIDKPSGWSINATSDITRVARQAVFVPVKPLSVPGGTRLTFRIKHMGGAVGQGLGRFRLSVTSQADPTAITKVPASLKPAIHKEPSNRTAKETTDLASLFRSVTPLLAADRQLVDDLQKKIKDLKIPTALIMGEQAGIAHPEAPMRNRGSFLSPGEMVKADVPGFLPRVKPGLPYNRLGLARWLVSDENPLTARVTVNRFWETIFGRGLVLTAEDFGTQGEGPSHPELLDWLAVRFRAGVSGGQRWDVKAILKLMVTSSAYRQTSRASRELLERDPYNRLLARGPRFRLEAEAIRDLSLAASGQLSEKIGGPSVFPVQPDGIWKSPYSSEKWMTSEGEDRFRRSIYTFIRRTSPFPQMITFDGTSRETCVVRRVRTNTPLQALTTLNDEAAMANARALASRMMAEGGGKLESEISYGFRLCTARPPDPKELEKLLAFFHQQEKSFSADLAAAAKVAGEKAGSLSSRAAMTMLANVLLNLDETLTKE